MTTAILPTEPDTTLRAALLRLGGRATLGDVVSATGMPDDRAETALRGLLETLRGHLEVTDSGELLYHFDPKLVERDREPWGVRFRRAAWSAFKTGFKIWTAVMLVAYFVLFVLIIVAMMVAASKDRDSFGGRRGGFGFGDFLILHWIFGGRGWRRGGLYYGDSYARRLPKEAQPPFHKKVFAFIFGPEEPKPTQQQRDRSVLQLIRARKGVLTATELVAHTGLPLAEAQEEMGRLTGAYGGDPHVSEGGEIVYAFPGLMKSAHGRVRASEPSPAWLRLEYPRKLTGNAGGANALVGSLNGFNLGASVVLGLGPAFSGTPVEALWFYGVGVVPAVFSTMFFGIPLVRWFGLRAGNEARKRRNVRRLLVRHVYAGSVRKVRWLPVSGAVEGVVRRLEGWKVTPEEVTAELERLAAEFNADVEAADAGLRYRFPEVRGSMVEAELMRKLGLDRQKLGRVVYSTSDESAAESERDRKAFDRELARADVSLSRYLRSPDRVGYEEDFEVVLGGEAPVRTRRPPRSRSRPRRQ